MVKCPSPPSEKCGWRGGSSAINRYKNSGFCFVDHPPRHLPKGPGVATLLTRMGERFFLAGALVFPWCQAMNPECLWSAGRARLRLVAKRLDDFESAIPLSSPVFTLT